VLPQAKSESELADNCETSRGTANTLDAPAIEGSVPSLAAPRLPAKPGASAEPAPRTRNERSEVPSSPAPVRPVPRLQPSSPPVRPNAAGPSPVREFTSSAENRLNRSVLAFAARLTQAAPISEPEARATGSPKISMPAKTAPPVQEVSATKTAETSR